MTSETLQQQLESAVTQIKSDSEILHDVVHGSNTQTVTVESGIIKTLAKAIADLQATINGITYATNGIGFGNPAQVKNRLHVQGGHINDEGNDYGITIEAFEPALTMIDASTNAGSTQIRSHSDGSIWFLRDTKNDGTIGRTSSDTTKILAKFSPDGPIFYDVNQVERARVTATGTIISGSFSCGSSKFENIIIGNDAVGEVIPPQTGGFLLFTLANSTYPQDRESTFIWFDVGPSPHMHSLINHTVFGIDVEVNTGLIDGTSASAGKILISAHEGKLLINNRYGTSQNFNISFI